MQNNERSEIGAILGGRLALGGRGAPLPGNDVMRLRGAVKIEYTLAKPRGGTAVATAGNRALPSHVGALNGAQAVQIVQAGLKSIYVSGWQVAGDMNTAQRAYPDQSLYPVDSVPTLVRRINNALQRADQIANNEGKPPRCRIGMRRS